MSGVYGCNVRGQVHGADGLKVLATKAASISRRLRVLAAADVAAGKVLHALNIEDAAAVAAV